MTGHCWCPSTWAGTLGIWIWEDPPFQRPLGGHVEFGEYALDTIHREFLEEIGQVLTDVRLLGVLENIFGWRGGTEHEVVFIFTAAFADEAAYEIEEQPILDNAGPARTVAASRCGQPAALPGRAKRADRQPVTASTSVQAAV